MRDTIQVSEQSIVMVIKSLPLVLVFASESRTLTKQQMGKSSGTSLTNQHTFNKERDQISILTTLTSMW